MDASRFSQLSEAGSGNAEGLRRLVGTTFELVQQDKLFGVDALHDPVGDPNDLPAIDEVVVDGTLSHVRTAIEPEERAATERLHAPDQCGHVVRNRGLAKQETGSSEVGGGVTAGGVGPVDDRRPVSASRRLPG